MKKSHSRSASSLKAIKYITVTICLGFIIFSGLKVVKTIQKASKDEDKKRLFSLVFSMFKDGPKKAVNDQLNAITSNFAILGDGDEKCKEGIDPNLRGSKYRSALHWSSLAGCLKEVHLLIKQGANVNRFPRASPGSLPLQLHAKLT